MLRQIGRFGIVGILATTVHIAVAYIAKSFGDYPPQLANLFGFLIAFLVSYFGHLHFTFQPQASSDRYFRRFLILSGLSFLTSSSVVYFLTNTLGVDFIWAMAGVAVIVPGVSFVAAKFWAFTETVEDEDTQYGTFVLLGLLLQLTAYFWFQSLVDLNHDTAWYLVATQKWLDGARLYTDIIEVNPPWGFYWTVPAIWLSKLTALDKQLSFLVFTGFLSAISFLSVWDSIKRIPGLTTIRKIVYAELVLIAVLIFTMQQVGQREHIFILCFLPYLFIVFAEAHGVSFSKKRRIILAMLALSGIMLKPYFIVLPLAVSLCEAVSARSFRPIVKLENWIIGVGCLLYLLFVYLVHPEYFSFLLPIAFTVYGGIGGTVDQVLSALPIVVILWLLLILWLGLIEKNIQKQTALLAATALGGAASYYLQFTGFEYHSYPFFVFAFIYFAFVLTGQGTRILIGCFAIVGILATLYFGPRPMRYRNVANEDILQHIGNVPENSVVMILSTFVHASFPIVLKKDWVWASRFPTQWLLPGALDNVVRFDCDEDPVKCQQNIAILEYARKANIEDIEKFKPDFIIIDKRKKGAYINDPNFDYITFMSEDPVFADHWEKYKQTVETNYFTIWTRSGS